MVLDHHLRHLREEFRNALQTGNRLDDLERAIAALEAECHAQGLATPPLQGGAPDGEGAEPVVQLDDQQAAARAQAAADGAEPVEHTADPAAGEGSNGNASEAADPAATPSS